MAENEVDESSITRVYVSGLPPSMTKEQLRSHFAGKFSVTDAHGVSDRRIGFVGFSSHEDAGSAVKYFNKSFFRMSKITVTLAKPIQVKRDTLGQAAPVSRKHLRHQVRQQGQAEIISRKRKRDTREDNDRAAKAPVGEPGRSGGAEHPEATSKTRKEEEETVQEDPVSEQNAEEPTKTNASASDTDWLRGKTSRLLDLVDETDQDIKTPPYAADPVRDHDPTTIDHGGDEVVTPSSDEPQTPYVPNARLFIRNLPFDAQEEGLRDTFSRYGRISEVSADTPCFCHPALL